MPVGSQSLHRVRRRPAFVVFDLDGTLVDSRRDLAESANELLAECGAPVHSEERVGQMVGEGAAVLVSRAFAAARCAPPSDALERFLSIYDRHLLNHTRLYPGVADVLESLHGQAPLAVLTNKPGRATARLLDGLGVRHYFGERIVGGDGPFTRKPSPQGLQHLIASAHVAAEETLMVGDSLVDWRTARHAHARPVLARYGFGYASFLTHDLDGDEWLLDRPLDLLTRWQTEVGQ